MTRRVLAGIGLVMALAAPVGAAEVDGVLIVGRAAAGEPWSDGPTEARLADGAELAIVGVAHDGKKVVYVVDADIDPLVIGGKTVGKKARRAWPKGVEARWSTVEPHAWREAGLVAPNGSDTPFYSNVQSGGEHHGEWLGYDRVTYFSTVVAEWTGGAVARRRPAAANPPRAEDDVWGGLGTMRYQVAVRVGKLELSTPGADAVDKFGILPSVHRVSIRRDDSIIGWLTAYFMVPEVFGSAGPGKNHQTDRWIGADCADVLVGARRAGGSHIEYTNVAGLPSYATQVADVVEFDENGAIVAGRQPEGVKEGDIIRIDYAGEYSGHTPRTWDHVALLYEDRSDPAGPSKGAADGKLDGFDLLVHMGHPMLKVEPLAQQLPAKLDVLRWKD